MSHDLSPERIESIKAGIQQAREGRVTKVTCRYSNAPHPPTRECELIIEYQEGPE